MSLREWFAKRGRTARLAAPAEGGAPEAPRPEAQADGLWTKCQKCKEVLYAPDLAGNLHVCPRCQYHHRVGGRERLAMLLDAHTLTEVDAGVASADPLGFVDTKSYPDRLADARVRSGEKEAIVTGMGRLGGIPVAIGAMDFFFLGGSMGSAVGEKLARLIELATARRLPLVLVTASGGARMQEGTLSLMQMAKTAAALQRFHAAGGLYVSVLADPTTGGVTASFATLADVLLAEPGALIGFTGRRVIEQTIRQQLPDDFQTAEYLLAHGLLDQIVPRPQLRATLGRLLDLHGYRPVAAATPPLVCPV